MLDYEARNLLSKERLSSASSKMREFLDALKIRRFEDLKRIIGLERAVSADDAADDILDAISVQKGDWPADIGAISLRYKIKDRGVPLKITAYPGMSPPMAYIGIRGAYALGDKYSAHQLNPDEWIFTRVLPNAGVDDVKNALKDLEAKLLSPCQISPGDAGIA